MSKYGREAWRAKHVIDSERPARDIRALRQTIREGWEVVDHHRMSATELTSTRRNILACLADLQNLLSRLDLGMYG